MMQIGTGRAASVADIFNADLLVSLLRPPLIRERKEQCQTKRVDVIRDGCGGECL
jgi:hypothetical protein